MIAAMAAAAADPRVGLPGATRRLARLFRLERLGRLERCPAAMARRLIERRAALIDAVIAGAEYRRRADAAAAHPPALIDALDELALEVGRCRPAAERRLRELTDELSLRRGEAPPSGLRGGAGGRLLGTS